MLRLLITSWSSEEVRRAVSGPTEALSVAASQSYAVGYESVIIYIVHIYICRRLPNCSAVFCYIVSSYMAGGEPFLHPFIFELIAAAKQAGLTTSVVTNGSCLTADKLLRLKVSMSYPQGKGDRLAAGIMHH